MRIRLTNRIDALLERTGRALAERREQKCSGVLVLRESEFDSVVATMKRAGPTDHGFLVVPEQMDLDAWLAKAGNGNAIQTDTQQA